MRKLSLFSLKSAAVSFVNDISTIGLTELTRLSNAQDPVQTALQESYFNHLALYEGPAPIQAHESHLFFKDLNVDLIVAPIRNPRLQTNNVTSVTKIYGLGYHIMLLLYDSISDPSYINNRICSSRLIFISRERTADYQTTFGIREIFRRKGNRDDIMAFLEERNLSLVPIETEHLTEMVYENTPKLGYLTHSASEEPSLRFNRVLQLSNETKVDGLEVLYKMGELI